LIKKKKKEVENKILEIACKIFKVKKKELTINSNTKNTPQWDSLTHINLLIEIKKNFNLILDINEVSEINSLKKWQKLIQKKI
jgi:acyl carrier protein